MGIIGRTHIKNGYVIHENGCIIGKRGLPLKHVNDGGGYAQVSLAVPRSVNRACRVSVKVHKLLYECFVGDVPHGMELNHIDGDKLNNRLDNIELVSRSDNVKHAITKLGRTTSRKLSIDDAEKIRQLRLDGRSVKDICGMFPISQKAVYQILQNKTYHVKSATKRGG